MNTIIEQRIWDYLDGTCTEQERKLIEELIKTDTNYGAVYRQLNELNKDFSQIELDEPSMGFNHKVMGKVALQPIPGTIRSLIDKRIIYGISTFFMITILILLGVVVFQINWSVSVTNVLQDYEIPRIDFSKYINNTVIKSFLFIDTILGLYMLDSLLRKKSA